MAGNIEDSRFLNVVDPYTNQSVRKADPIGGKIFENLNYGYRQQGKGGGGSATPYGDQYAALTRQSWYDYMNTLGVPQENALIKYATDPTVVSGAMSEASSDATGAFDRQQVATERRLSGLGLTLTAEEQGAADRSSNLARSLADVGAMNRARDQTIARQQSILGSPAPSIGALRP